MRFEGAAGTTALGSKATFELSWQWREPDRQRTFPTSIECAKVTPSRHRRYFQCVSFSRYDPESGG